MIYNETLNYMLRHANAIEIDILTYLSNRVDWAGIVHFNERDLVQSVGKTNEVSYSKTRYVRKRLESLVSTSTEKKVFSKVHTVDGEKLMLNLGVRPIEHSRITRYTKQFRMFRDLSFRGLSVAAKRLVLYYCKVMCQWHNEATEISVDELVSGRSGRGLPSMSSTRLEEVLEEIQYKLEEVVDVARFRREEELLNDEIVKVYFKKGFLNKFTENRTERSLLRKNLVKGGRFEELEDDFCVQLEKTQKSFLLNLFNMSKDRQDRFSAGTSIDLTKEAMLMGKTVVSKALSKLSKSLNKGEVDVETPDALSAYFRGILYQESVDEMASRYSVAGSIRDIIDRTKTHLINMMTGNVEKLPADIQKKENEALLNDTLSEILKEWNKKYHMVRFSRMEEEVEQAEGMREQEQRMEKKKDSKKYFEKIREQLMDLKEEWKEVTQSRKGIFGANRLAHFYDEVKDGYYKTLRTLDKASAPKDELILDSDLPF